MIARNDGGPAFPRQAYAASHGAEGMSLRDWFAGQALAGVAPDYQPITADDASEIARIAYAIADAMLAARGGKP